MKIGRESAAANKNSRKKGNKIEKGFFAYLNPKNLVQEVDRYGYHFSLSGFWKFYFLAFLGILCISLIYRLKWFYILVILCFSILISPAVILCVYRNLYEQKRFLDVTNYLEQLLYSFRKMPKILTALQDALLMFPEGRMHDLIVTSMDHIQHKKLNEREGLYDNAFWEMEEEYQCRRMKQAHDFLIKVENFGGNFTNAVDILLEDRRLWIERSYELEQERKHLKAKIIISLVLSFLICGMTMFMLPSDFGTLDSVLSQCATTALMISNIFIFYIAQKKLSVGWMNDMQEDKEEIERYYNNVVNFDKKKENRKSLAMAAACAGVCMVGMIMRNAAVTVCGVVSVIFSFMHPGMKLKNGKKHIMREIDKAFPVWIMELSLLLQTDNPQVALTKSVEKAPYILKKDLTLLVDRIEKDPSSVEPYIQFMPDFDLPDVQSALRMVYSMSESGTEDAQGQIMFLVERNNRLLDKAERMQNEDRISGTGILILIPMVTGSLKMMVDLGVFLISLLSMTKQ